MNRAIETLTKNINNDVFDLLKTHIPKLDMLSNIDIVRLIIETFLFENNISDDDEFEAELNEHFIIIEKHGYTDFNEWFTVAAHRAVEAFGDVCKNCRYVQDNDFCIYHNCFVRPLSIDRECFVSRDN